MIEVLLLRFDAPLMSFGGPIVDQRGVGQSFPAASMLTGLLGNALGYDHRDGGLLQSLQQRLRYAVRCDREGELLIDFQTVDFSQDQFQKTGWTTWGVREDRRGGKAADGTHIRRREYHADAVYTVSMGLAPADEDPDLDRLATALDEPARPLFIGRKPCLPASRILIGKHRTSDLVSALGEIPLAPARGSANSDTPIRAWWSSEAAVPSRTGQPVAVTDQRDWRNQIHCGRRIVIEGTVTPAEVTDGE